MLLCLSLFKVIVYCSIPLNIHDLDLPLEEESIGRVKKKFALLMFKTITNFLFYFIYIYIYAMLKTIT